MPEHERPPDDERAGNGENGEETPAEAPGNDDPQDPFERETIRYAAEERLLGVTLEGPKVGEHNIDVYFLGEFLAQLDRVVRALTAAAEGLTLGVAGKIPRPPEAAPWRARGLAFGRSATLEFELGDGEATRMSDDGEVTSPTIEAVGALGHLVALSLI